MDLFTLMGMISVENADAIAKIEAAIEKAKELNSLLENGASINISGGGSSGGGSSSATTPSSPATPATPAVPATPTTPTTPEGTTESGSTGKRSNWQRTWDTFLVSMGTRAMYGIANTVTDFFGTGMEYLVAMELHAANLKTFVQDDNERADLVGALEQFAIDTPLSIEEVFMKGVSMLSQGVKTEDLITTLSMMSDITRGNTEVFSKVAKAFTDSMAAGKMNASNARSFTENGVPIWEIIARYYSAIDKNGRDEWKDTDVGAYHAKDPVPFKDLYNALMMAVKEGGMFFNATENAMDTYAGQREKLNDALNKLSGELVRPIFEMLTNGGLESITKMVESLTSWITSNPEALASLGEGLGDALTFITKSITTVASYLEENDMSIVDVFSALATTIGAILIAVNPVAGTLLSILGYVGMISHSVTDGWGEYKDVIDMTEDANKPKGLLGWLDFFSNTDARKALSGLGAALLNDPTKMPTGPVTQPTNPPSEGDSTSPLPAVLEKFLNGFAFFRWARDYAIKSNNGGGDGDSEIFGPPAPENGSDTPDWQGDQYKELSDSIVEALDRAQGDGSYTVEEIMAFANSLTAEDIGVEESELASFLANFELYVRRLFPNGEDRNNDANGDGAGTDATVGGTSIGAMAGVAAGILPGDADAGATALIGQLQLAIAALNSAPEMVAASVFSAIQAGIGAITVEGTVTTGNVVLNTGTLVGAIMPTINMKLGQAQARSNRG